MAIASDHVRRDKEPPWLQRFRDGTKQMLELEHMMQRLVGHNGFVLTGGAPIVEISLRHQDEGRHAFPLSHFATTLEHRGIDVDALDRESFQSAIAEPLGDSHFCIAVSSANAYEARRLVSFTKSSLLQVQCEEFVRMIEAKLHCLGT